MTVPFAIRPVRDGDAQDLLGLIALCFAQYPGCFLDPHDDVADLVAPAAAFAGRGAFWASEDGGGRICGAIALDWPEPGTAELHRFYVRPDRQGAGLGRALLAHAERHARGEGARRVILWSDTRFVRAHGLYERAGFTPTGRVRTLGDVSRSREAGFAKALDGTDVHSEY